MIKTIVRSLLFIGLILILSACHSIEIGIEPTATQQAVSTATPTVAPTLAFTNTPPGTIITPTIEQLLNFSQSSYGFSFQYPSSWSIQQEQNAINLQNGNVELRLRFKKVGEDFSILSNPQPIANLKASGSINFLTQTITRDILVDENAVRTVFYNQGNEVNVGSILFTFVLTESQPTNNLGISNGIQEQADSILASFVATFDLTSTPCTDKITFVQDVTIPDDTRFSPGESFTKTWRLQNTGTCTWTKEYALVYIDSDQMSGESPQFLTDEVIPGQTADFSVDFTAPASSGTYRGNWMLQNDKGDRFGLGIDADKPFWVQITVGETTPDILQSLGEPSFTDSFASTNNWFLLDTPDAKFSAGDNKLILTALKTGQDDEWGIANVAPLRDFYIEFTFTTSDPCSGLDRYGVIVRAPEPNQGYIFGFSCDGRYHLYKWDGKQYHALQEWKNSPSIKQGPNQTNRLGISIKGNNLRLYANGQFLSEYTDDTYSEGRFGVFIGAGETVNFTVSLDEVSYWKFGN